jgi:hypothetical protein
MMRRLTGGRRQVMGIAMAFVIASTVAFLGTGRAQAHELATDKGISAVLHIAPDDNPYAGRETFMKFDFTSQNPGFDVRYCECRVTVQTASNQLLTSTVYSNSNSPTRGHAVVNFPAAGVYEVEVRGLASEGRPVSRFRLVYPVRVAASQSASAVSITSVKSLQVLLISLTSLVVLGVVATAAIQRGGRYAQVTQKKRR